MSSVFTGVYPERLSCAWLPPATGEDYVDVFAGELQNRLVSWLRDQITSTVATCNDRVGRQVVR